MANSRVTQAFESADPVANRSLDVPEHLQYGFVSNASSRLPFGDELAALTASGGPYIAGLTGMGPPKTYQESLNYARFMERAAQEKYRREHPGGDIGGIALGVVAGGSPMGAPAAFGVRGAPAAAAIPRTVGQRALQGVEQGAKVGALSGAGEGEGLDPVERAKNAIKGAAGGMAVGAALPYLGAAVRSGRRLSGWYDPAIGGHVQRLEQEADNFYNQADQAGVQISQPTFLRMAHNVNARAHAAGIDPNKHQQAYTVLHSLMEEAAGRGAHNVGRIPNLRRMDQIRQDIRDVVSPNAATRTGNTASERRIARAMLDGWDEQLNRLTPRDVTAGNPRAGMNALNQARDLRHRFYKAETIDNILENARDAVGANYTQAGLQTAIRQQFRALNKRIRKGQEPGWNNEERRLINLITRGGTGENLMRWIGMLALRGKSGAGAYATSTAAGSYALGPAAIPLAIGAAGAGELTRRASTARGIMNVEALDRLIGTGTAQVPQRQLGPISQRLGQGRRLAIGLGTRLLTGDQ
jgi:hypothetical protein